MASYNKKEHLRANIDAIQTVFTLHREHRTATEEEMKVLRAYTGFGALKCILSPANSMEDIARWNKSEVELFPLVMELHRVIRDNTASETQYKSYMQSLKNSVMTAFYTPEPVVREIAVSLQEAGIAPGKILDPSAGMGEFIRSFYGIATEGHTTFGFEKDILTGQLLSALHPDDKIRIRGFEEIESKFEGYFDVVSSNIPFGDIAVFDPVFSKTDEPARKVARMSLHNYKFNLLHNKQLFIERLKNNRLGSRTIDEGSMDEKSGMNFSEYVAILSGNTDLLEKAKLEKKIAGLESERRSFMRSRQTSRSRLDEVLRAVDGNKELIARFKSDWDLFESRVQKDKDGNKLNPIQLKGVEGSDPKRIAAKLAEVKEHARTKGAYFDIGTLYDFKIVVKTESSSQSLFDLSQNRFFIMGESGMKYSYNNGNIAADPVLASMNFLNALEKIPSLIQKYEADTVKIAKNIPVLQETVNGSWKKEEQLKDLKTELSALDRQIQLSLKPIEQGDAQQEEENVKEQKEMEENISGQSRPIEPIANASSVCTLSAQTDRQPENVGQSIRDTQPLTDGVPSLASKTYVIKQKM